MAAKNFININGTNCKNIVIDGAVMKEGYVDGVHVCSQALVLHLSQSSGVINLASWIASKISEAHGEIIVINDHVQPSIVIYSKNFPTILNNSNITLINNGEILGAHAGAHAMVIEKPIKLINKGWIRGAGGNGGTGGKGGTGGRGHAGSNDHYTTHVDRTVYVPSNCRIAGRSVNYSHFGTRFIWDGHTMVMGGDKLKGWYTIPGITKSSTFHAGKYVKHINCGAGDATEYRIIERRTSSHPRHGGTGGHGGAGGHGGHGGGGQYYGHANTGGAVGSKGAVGHNGAASKPSGGHSGAKGGTGGTGGHGGAGGSWGKSGYKGGTGAKGGTGYSHGSGGSNGTGGVAGLASGKSIVGKSHLKAGSVTGRVNGTIV